MSYTAKYYGGFLSTKAVATRLGVSTFSVNNYIKQGRLRATNLSHGTQRPIWGIAEDDLNAFIKGYKPREVKHKEVEKPKAILIEKPEHVDSKKLKVLKLELELLRDRLFDITCEIDDLINK